MGQREKLIAKMRASPHKIRFDEVLALVKYLGFTWTVDGSHYSFSHSSHPYAIQVVRPHGGTSTVRPTYIRNLIRELERAQLLPPEDE
jgi:predicted RNA binding protein YcfA (HicA-like mRNA interferase family)